MSLDSDIKELIVEVGTSQEAVTDNDDDEDDDDDSDDENGNFKVLRSGKRVSFLYKCNEHTIRGICQTSIIRSMSE